MGIPRRSSNPETVLLEKEKKELLDRAVEGLESNERVIIRLHLEGYSKAAIAHIMGKKAGAIRIKYLRILAKLRAKITRKEELEHLTYHLSNYTETNKFLIKRIISGNHDEWFGVTLKNSEKSDHKNIFVNFLAKFKSMFRFIIHYCSVSFTICRYYREIKRRLR